jgi:DNA polymerase III subunit delta
MIIKTFELNKINIDNKKIFLFYGQNEGFKKEILKKNFEVKFQNKIYRYDEKNIIDNKENFFSEILTKSFFDNEKLIVVNRTTDKILEIIKEIIEKKIEEIKIILVSGTLDKKSKLRSYFEKEPEVICIPFYTDTDQTLSNIISSFFRDKKIPISQEIINLLVNRCRGDRQNLNNEINKVENFVKNKKNFNVNDIFKLTNLAENYDVSQLVDNCLSKNIRKTVNILNENSYSSDDGILIIRTFLIKLKRLNKIQKEILKNNNIDKSISSFKPPIFWKDKEIVKQQIKSWSYKNIRHLIHKVNDVELLIKKNSNSSINIVSDFIIEQATTTSN